MLYKLALRNIARNRVYYGFYFFIIVVFAMLLYSVISISSSIQIAFEQFNLNVAGMTVDGIFNVMKWFVIILSLFFSLYISQFFIKRRSDELALYKLLGLNNAKILKLIGIENGIIVLCAIILGSLSGVFFGRIFQQLCMNIMQIDISVGTSLMDANTILINANAFANVFLMLVGIWLISYVIPYLYVRNISIAKLFVKRSQASRIAKAPIFSIVCFFISSIYLITVLGFIGHYLLDYINVGSFILSILFAAIICAFTLYKGFLFVIIRIIRKFKIHLKSPALLLSLKHIETDTRQLFKLLAVVSIVVGIMTPFGLLVKTNENIMNESAITSPKAINQFSYVTNSKEVDDAFLKALSSERGFSNFEITYHKIVTEDGTFYLMNQDNILKLSYLANSKNGYTFHYEDADFKAIENLIKGLTDEQLLFLDSFISENTLPNMNQSLYRDFEQLKLTFFKEMLVRNNPTTLHNSLDYNYDQLVLDHQKKLDQFLLENPELVASYDGEIFNDLYQFVPFNNDVTINHDLVIASPKIYNEWLDKYTSEKLTMRIFITNDSIISSGLINDLLEAKALMDNIEDPYATNIIVPDYVVSFASIINFGSLSILAVLIYALLFFVLISTTLFRTLESGEKGNYEYKVAALLGVKKSSVLKGITLEAAMIMIIPFFMGFIISTLIYNGMLLQVMSDQMYQDTSLDIASILGVALPILVAILIMFSIAIQNIYINVFKEQ